MMNQGAVRGGAELNKVKGLNLNEGKSGLLKRFEDYLIARNRKSVDRYLRIASEYLASCSEDELFTAHSVNRYLADLARRGAGGRTRRWRYYILKTFFRAVGQPWPFEPGDAPKVEEESEVPIFTEEEMRRLEEAAKSHPDPELAARNYALIRLENCLGLRRGEIRNLNISDYQPPYLRVKTLKGGRVVYRALDPETCRALDEWIKIRRRKRRQADPEALFVRGKRGPRISLRGLSAIFAEIRQRAGIEKPRAGFHASRRGRITDLHRRGISGPTLTKEWGWKSPQTVQTYIKLSKHEAEKAIQQAHPYWQEASRHVSEAEEE